MNLVELGILLTAFYLWGSLERLFARTGTEIIWIHWLYLNDMWGHYCTTDFMNKAGSEAGKGCHKPTMCARIIESQNVISFLWYEKTWGEGEYLVLFPAQSRANEKRLLGTMSSQGWNISVDWNPHNFSESHPIFCPLSWCKSALNVKPEFPVFRIALVASCPSTFNEGQTAVTSPLPLLFPWLNHHSSLYLPCLSCALALTIVGTFFWTHCCTSGSVLHWEPKSGPCTLRAVSVVLRIGATYWSTMKCISCVQFP